MCGAHSGDNAVPEADTQRDAAHTAVWSGLGPTGAVLATAAAAGATAVTTGAAGGMAAVARATGAAGDTASWA